MNSERCQQVLLAALQPLSHMRSKLLHSKEMLGLGVVNESSDFGTSTLMMYSIQLRSLFFSAA